MNSTKKLLSEVSTLASGGTPDRKNKDYWQGDIPWVTTAEVSQYQFILDTKEKITEQGLKNSSAKLFPKGSILLALYGQGKTRGKVALLGIDAATNQACLAIKPDNTLIKTEYLFYFLDNSYEKLRRMANVGGQDNLSMALLKEFPISFPNLSIQEYRINLFDKLSMKIQLQQEKIDLLKEQKNGLINKIFSQQLRFPGFTEPWEKFKLGDLGSVVMNKRIFKNQTSATEEIPFYKIGTFGGKPDAFITRNLFEEYKNKYPFPEIGDILLSASGSIGRTVVYKGEEAYFQDSNIVWLKHDERINKTFLKHFYSIVKWKGLEGSTIQRLYNKNILETEIQLPSIKEQKKIGQFLDKLDEMIQINEEKLEFLHLQKNFFMKQMFV